MRPEYDREYRKPVKSKYADIMFPKECEFMIIGTELEVLIAEEEFAKATQDLPVSTPERKRIGVRWDYEAYRYIERVVLKFSDECIKRAKWLAGRAFSQFEPVQTVADIRRHREEFLGTVTAYAFNNLMPEAERTNPESFGDFVAENLRRSDAWLAHLKEVDNLLDVSLYDRWNMDPAGVKAPDEEVTVVIAKKHEPKANPEYDREWQEMWCTSREKRETALDDFKERVQEQTGAQFPPSEAQIAKVATVTTQSFRNWKNCKAGYEVHIKIVRAMTKDKWIKDETPRGFTVASVILTLLSV